jgi:hypothetical protein
MYEFTPGQAAIVTEIYLPAKYVISARVPQALDNSLVSERIEEHFSQAAASPRAQPSALAPDGRQIGRPVVSCLKL